MGRSLITTYGEAFGGPELERMAVVGVMTAKFLKIHELDGPIIRLWGKKLSQVNSQLRLILRQLAARVCFTWYNSV